MTFQDIPSSQIIRRPIPVQRQSREARQYIDQAEYAETQNNGLQEEDKQFSRRSRPERLALHQFHKVHKHLP